MRTKVGLIIMTGFLFFHCHSDVPSRQPIMQSQTLDSGFHAELPKAHTRDFSSDELLGRFEPATHPDFVKIQTTHTSKSEAYLRADAYTAFVSMYDAARKDGITLTIISATRNFSAQKGIWEAKWNGDRLVEGKNLKTDVKDSVERARMILRFSSMPGTSRHHWGTDIDINNLENQYFATGKGKLEYEWLVKHAGNYGYYQPYTVKDSLRPYGYEEEKWHWSYLPLSKQMTQQYKDKITTDSISGFKGSGTAGLIDVINRYVLGIHPEGLP